MIKLKHLGAASLLTVLLVLSTSAGEIQLGVASPLPSPPPAVSSTPGEIQLPGSMQGPGSAGASVTDVALNLLQELLLVF
jgi:hypothetical protein